MSEEDVGEETQLDEEELAKLKKEVHAMIDREFDSSVQIELCLKDIKFYIGEKLPEDKTKDRIEDLKDDFFDLDNRMAGGNWKDIKAQKKDILYKILLEQQSIGNVEKQVASLKNDLRFVFMLKIEDYEKLSWTRYGEIRGTVSTHPYKDIACDLPKNSKYVKMLLEKTSDLKGRTPGENRLIYVAYCHAKDSSGKLHEYLFPGVADSKTVKQKFSIFNFGHLNLAIDFAKNHGQMANLFERFIAVFGSKNVHIFITDFIAIPKPHIRKDPIRYKLKDYYKTEFGKDLQKSELGLLDK